MKIKSLGFLTDLMFHSQSGIVEVQENMLIVKNPDNPYYFWGNFLLLETMPTADRLADYEKLFIENFSSLSVEHVALTWDCADDNQQSYDHFSMFGYVVEKTKVLTAKTLKFPKNFNHEIEIRIITTESEWELVFENQIRCREQHFDEESYRQFLKPKFSNYKKMIELKKGFWFGAFLNDELVGDLGLFFENNIARYQGVETLPEYRSLGICSTLLYQSYLQLQAHQFIENYVITAAVDYHAAKIYQSLGFEESEQLIGLCKFNKSKWSTQK